MTDEYNGMSIDSRSKYKGTTILHWNCKKLNNKCNEITYIITQSKYDVAIFSESWLTDATEDGMLDLDGYCFFRQD